MTQPNQSGEGFSQSITSDCLSRLEDHGQAAFDEEVVRDVSGVMFSGESASGFHIYPCVSQFWLQLELRRYAGIAIEPPVTSLTLRSDKVDLENVLLGNDSQPQSDEESSGGTGSSRWERTSPGFL